MKEVNFEDFVESFGAQKEGMPDECRELIEKGDFKYEILEGEDRDAVLLDVLRKLETDKQVIGAEERKDVWHDGWQESLEEFIESNYDPRKLVPKFIRPNKVIRFNGQYIKPENPNFELDYYSVFRKWLFLTYFKDFENIYEFGCGTGFNLLELSDMYPDKHLYGSDFVQSSVDLVNKIGEVSSLSLEGFLFDMIHPDKSAVLKDKSLVFTIGAIEQLAGKFEEFLQYLLDNSPGLCVHVEPTVELYDEDNLLDYLAARFHRKRGYTEGFLPRLQELEKEGKVEIVKVKRLFFGSLFMEGYNLIIWKPVT